MYVRAHSNGFLLECPCWIFLNKAFRKAQLGLTKAANFSCLILDNFKFSSQKKKLLTALGTVFNIFENKSETTFYNFRAAIFNKNVVIILLS
jgi:hypothetical protein